MTARSLDLPATRVPITPPAGRAEVALLGCVLLLSAAIRYHEVLLLPIFNDEAIYLRWAADILDRRTWLSLFIPVQEDGKQPLFVWMAAANMAVLHDPLLAGRIVSVLAGVLSTIGIFLGGRWLFGAAAGLAASFLYAVTPYVVIFDRLALADSVVNAVSIWALCLGIAIASRTTVAWKALALGALVGVTLGVGIWVKPTALFALPMPLLCALLLPGRRGSTRVIVVALAAGYAVFAVLASLLVLIPYAENQMRLLATHVNSPDELSSSVQSQAWLSNLRAYGEWLLAYLPAPLYWLSIIGAAWGLGKQRRTAVLLLACWLSVMLPSVAMAQSFASRYMVHSVFPLILLAALPLGSVGEAVTRLAGGTAGHCLRRAIAACVCAALVVGVSVPSLAFDVRLVSDPWTAPWPPSDRYEYLEGWPAGSGFDAAVQLTLRRAAEYDSEVFVLSDHFQGLPHDGLALYVRHVPRVRHYVDGRIAWGAADLADAWRSHRVPILIVRNYGRFGEDSFEKAVPEAKLIGVFPKRESGRSFRVYEMDLRDVH